MKYKLMATFAVAVGLFMFAGNALASTSQHSQAQAVSLYRPFPEGLPANNAVAAFHDVMNRASWDNQYAMAIAQQTGAESFNASDYAPGGYRSHAPAGTTNSALNGSGMIVPVADHGGSQNVEVMVIINIKTSRTVSLMVRCGNPRLHPFVPVVPFKPFSKGTIIAVNRSVSKPVSITCPSGQTVSGTITATVKGTIRARTWGTVQGNLNLKLQQKVNLKVKAFASLSCGPAPAPTTPQTFSATATATANASATCPDGTTATASGSGFGSATSTVSQQDAQNKANAVASAQANANANAAIKCAAAPPPAPPAAPCQPSVSVTTINDLDAGGNSPNFHVTVTMCSNAGTLNVTAQFGSVPGGSSVSVSGQNTYTFTYFAPGEVPPGGQDWVTATVRDSTTGAVASASTPKFNINPPPPSS